MEEQGSIGAAIGLRLQAIQGTTGIKDVELARVTGLDSSYFSRLRAGKIGKVGYDTLTRIARALAVSPGALIGKDEANLTLPIPAAYFRAMYGINSSELAQLADQVLKGLASQEQNNGTQVDTGEVTLSPHPKRGGGIGLTKLIERIGAEAAAEDASIRGRESQYIYDPQLLEIIASWRKLDNSTRASLLNIIRRIA